VKRIHYILILLYLSSGVHGQNYDITLINQVRILETRDKKFTLDYRNVEGTPYYTGDFVRGVVYLKDGNFATLQLRYDIFRDEIEFLKEK
jgi:hypothetical protein